MTKIPPPTKSSFVSHEEYDDALNVYEDALDSYEEECLERHFENR